MRKAILIPPPISPPISLVELFRLHTVHLGEVAAMPADILNAVQRDSEERRRVISLVLKGYTYRQVGAALGMTHGEVGSHVKRGMKRAWSIVSGLPVYRTREELAADRAVKGKRGPGRPRKEAA